MDEKNVIERLQFWVTLQLWVGGPLLVAFGVLAIMAFRSPSSQIERATSGLEARLASTETKLDEAVFRFEESTGPDGVIRQLIGKHAQLSYENDVLQ